MFRNEFESLQDLLSEGHKLVTQSVLFFGFLLVTLAGLIFMFPAIIGTLFAIFIFLAGHIHGAQNIPHDEVVSMADTLKRHKTICIRDFNV